LEGVSRITLEEGAEDTMDSSSDMADEVEWKDVQVDGDEGETEGEICGVNWGETRG
jgi:hypothetical protein